MGLPEPAFWGALEVASFLLLFLSPLFSEATMVVLWYGMVYWRVGASALWWDSAEPEPLTMASRWKELGRALAYGVPFWTSALLFPLSNAQTVLMTRAFGLYLVLILSARVFTSFPRPGSPFFLAILTGLALSGFGAERSLVVASGLLSAAGFYGRDGRSHGAGSLALSYRRLASVLVSGGWALCLVWVLTAAGTSQAGLSRLMLLWVFVVSISAHSVLRARGVAASREAREVEYSLPSLEEGLRWRYSREMISEWKFWLGFLLAVSWKEPWWLGLTLVSAFGLHIILSKEYLSSLHWQWWSCGQFVIYWGAAETQGVTRYCWLLLNALLALAIALNSQRQSSTPLETVPVSLEQRLHLALRVKAPEHLRREVLAQIEPSVDIDTSLQSSAPSGFRERLLQRLKDDESA